MFFLRSNNLSMFSAQDKVRDLYYNAPSQRLVSMCVNGDVGVWTPDLQLIQKVGGIWYRHWHARHGDLEV